MRLHPSGIEETHAQEIIVKAGDNAIIGTLVTIVVTIHEIVERQESPKADFSTLGVTQLNVKSL